MQVPHDAVVLVADGRKMLFLRNEGDAEFPNLQVVDKEIHPNPKDSDQKTDLAGQSSSTRSGPGAPAAAQGGSMHAMGGGAQFASGGTMGETDYHQLEEDKFAAETAEMLKKRALNNEYESLIIIAPPRTLGELRKHYHKEVSDRLKAEIDKDLTGHTVPQIEEALARAE
jgi:protein required for attachment to host cells